MLFFKSLLLNCVAISTKAWGFAPSLSRNKLHHPGHVGRSAGILYPPFLQLQLRQDGLNPDEAVSSDEKDERDYEAKERRVEALESRVIDPGFKLSLEFEHWPDCSDDSYVSVFLPYGRKYTLFVWTYDALPTIIQNNGWSDPNGTYVEAPDLFVKEMTRDCIERVIADLLTESDGYLENVLDRTVIASVNPYWNRHKLWRWLTHKIWWGLKRIRKRMGRLGFVDEFEQENYTMQKPVEPTNNTIAEE